MSYEKQTWNTGDVITAEKLNHIEDGIDGASPSGGGNFVVTLSASAQGMSVDKTYAQIKSAIESGQNVVLDDPVATKHLVPLTSYDFREDYENIKFSYTLGAITDDAITSLTAFEVNITKDSVVSYKYAVRTFS